jgi:hydroxymethylpyrimidine/phosphomethylpyrimidine kinase
MNKTNTVLSIAGSDSGGGAGIFADLKTFAALSVHGTGAITAITAQNTTGVKQVHNLPSTVVMNQIDAICEDMTITHAKTGMLSSSEIILSVAQSKKKHNFLLTIDPVMSAEAGGSLIENDAVKSMIEVLLPLSNVITPNINEASTLSKTSIKSLDDAKNAAKIICDMGALNTIITGGHLNFSDVLYESEEERYTIISGKLKKGGTHGSGCTHSAALTAFLSLGFTVRDATFNAKKFVENAIKTYSPIGKGINPVNPLANIIENSNRYLVLQDVEHALFMLKNHKDFANLIPEVGTNIAMAIPNAENINDIAAVDGRIVKLKEMPATVGAVEFGASGHVARMVLAVMKFNPNIRGSINIRYSDEILDIIKDLNLNISTFNRANEPEYVSTMDWGVTNAIESYGSTPDVIYDKGGIGKEPMIRIFGTSAKEVSNVGICIAEKLKKNEVNG